MESEAELYDFDLTRVLHANRHSLRWKTLWLFRGRVSAARIHTRRRWL
jgi:hypothetical protein